MPDPPLEISCLEVQALLAAGTLVRMVDCREPDEHALVSLPETKLFPLSQLAAQSEVLNNWKEDHVVILCHHGMRSAQLTIWLREKGFLNVQSMAGGIDEWARTIDPTLPRY